MSIPEPAFRSGLVEGSVYSNLVGEFSQFSGERYPFHVGDTWLEPPPGCRVEDLGAVGVDGMNRYTQVAGWAPLLDAFRARIRARTGVEVPSDGIFACAGATGGLAALVQALVDPGREVLVLAPAWPLLANMVRLAGGIATHVPFIGEVDAPEAATELLDRYVRPETVAVYLNTPNNPSGCVIPRPVLEAVAAWARRRGLWILSDEVYEDYVYTGGHTWMMSLAPERTIGVWSFSKGFGMAGYRVGIIAGPTSIIQAAIRVSTYTYYCAPFPGQVAALQALSEAGERWVQSTRQRYREIGGAVAERLGVAAPEGGTFLLLDVSDALGSEGLGELLRRCVRRGLLLAPGTAFGPYPRHVRLCFTAAPPEVTLRGTEVLAGILGR